MGPTQSPIKLPEAQHQLCRGSLVFSNPVARILPDEKHSVEEPREETDHIRIISARRATRAEQHDYEEHVAK